MKKYLIKIIVLIILFSLIFTAHYSSLAHTEEFETTKITKVADSTALLSEDFTENFDPTNGKDVENLTEPFTSAIVEIVSVILGIVQVIGGLLMVISIAMFGFGMIVKADMPLARDLGLDRKFPMGGGDSSNARKDLLDYGRILIIGSVLLLASSTIVKIMINLLL